MFDGLDILCTKDKSVCFVHPKDFEQQAKKRSDMPTKFQMRYEDWAQFNKLSRDSKTTSRKVADKYTTSLSGWEATNRRKKS
jgi:hypothetical protein